MNIKYCMLAENASIDKNTRRLTINNIFDTFSQTMFPVVIKRLTIVLGIGDIEDNEKVSMKIVDPEGESLQETEIEIAKDNTKNVTNKIIFLDEYPFIKRGQYTIEFAQGEEVIYKDDFLNIDYPPKRNITDEEKEAILASEDLIKTVNMEYALPGSDKKYKWQLNLDKDQSIEEGCEAFPEDDKLVEGDKEVDLTGIRRQMEWMFGRRVVKQQPKPQPKPNDDNVIKISFD